MDEYSGKSKLHWSLRLTISAIAGGVCFFMLDNADFVFRLWWRFCRKFSLTFSTSEDMLAVDILSGFVSLLIAVCLYQVITQHFGPGSAVNETRCRNCGYILRGITEPRCPECGERI